MKCGCAFAQAAEKVDITSESKNAWTQQMNRSAAFRNRKPFSPENFRAVY
jgi:hypothetical protein